MIRKNPKNTGIQKRVLACIIAGCMILDYGNASLPTVYATDTTTSDTPAVEQIATVSAATPKNATEIIDTYTDTQGITYTLNLDQTCIISGHSSTVKETLVIPKKISVNSTVYSVISIKDCAFSYCSHLKSVTLPEGLTEIGKYAFAYCSALPSITIPSSVTSIGEYAFSNCESLTAINVSQNSPYYMCQDGVLYTKKGDTLLCCPAGKKSINKIPSTVTAIGNRAFYKCQKLTSINIPSTVTSIGNSAFRYCISLSSLNIPSSVKTIGSYAFSGCRLLTNANIPEGVTSIGDSAFASCMNLTNITIPATVTDMGMAAFEDCCSLTTVINRSKVTSIKYCTFYGCSSLTNVNIPETVTTINECAFQECISLKSINIPSSVTRIKDYAFEGCNHLTAINIPENVTSIDDYAFRGCIRLKSVSILSNVSYLGNGAFLGCKKAIIYAEPSSTAETYAKNNGVQFCAAYQIVYQLNGGTNNTKNPSIYTTQANVKLASPQKSGYLFKGWYKTADFKSSSKVTTISKNSKGKITLYAKWEKVKKPAKISLKTVKSNKSGTITITVKKGKSVSGYEYVVATNKKFTKNVKTVTTKKLTTTFKGLKKGKTYYVRARAYRIDSANGKVFGAYSKVKTVKVRK